MVIVAIGIVVALVAAVVLRVVASGGVGAGVFAPVDVAVGPGGEVFIYNHDGVFPNIKPFVVRIASDGKQSVLAGTGSKGMPREGRATASPLHGGDGLAVDSAGNVYIADMTTVERVTTDGTLSIIAGTGKDGNPVAGPATASPIGDAEAVAVDPEGNVYIEDVSSNMVLKVTPDGVLSIFAGNGRANFGTSSPVPGPATSTAVGTLCGMAIDTAGNLYITDSVDIYKITPEGVLSVYISEVANIMSPMGTAMALGPEGDVYVASRTTVMKLSRDGSRTNMVGDGKEGYPIGGNALASRWGRITGLDFDAQGDLYVSDNMADVVARVTPSGVLSILAHGPAGPPN